MKVSISTVCTALITVCFLGCQSTPTPLTELEEEEIKNEVRQAFENTTVAVNAHDAVKIMESCWNDNDYLYAAQGTLTKGWERNNEISTAIHTDPKNKSFTLEYDETIIKVINRDAVLLVGRGYFHNILTEEGVNSVDIVITFLLEKIDDKWLITVGHESYPEALLLL